MILISRTKKAGWRMKILKIWENGKFLGHLCHFGAALRLLWGCFRTALGLLWGRFRTTLGMLLGCIEAASGTLRGTSGMLRGHSGAPVLWGLGPLCSALLLGITIQIAYSSSWDWRVFSFVYQLDLSFFHWIIHDIIILLTTWLKAW